MEEAAIEYAQGDQVKYDAFMAGCKFMKEGKSKKTISIEEREERFKKTLEPYLHKYGRDMLNKFFLYWTEKNKSGKKMRFEMQPTWELSKRLSTWYGKNREFGGRTAKDSESLARNIAEGIARAYSEQ